jgi:hypothetical protein
MHYKIAVTPITSDEHKLILMIKLIVIVALVVTDRVTKPIGAADR